MEKIAAEKWVLMGRTLARYDFEKAANLASFTTKKIAGGLGRSLRGAVMGTNVAGQTVNRVQALKGAGRYTGELIKRVPTPVAAGIAGGGLAGGVAGQMTSNRE